MTSVSSMLIPDLPPNPNASPLILRRTRQYLGFRGSFASDIVEPRPNRRTFAWRRCHYRRWPAMKKRAEFASDRQKKPAHNWLSGRNLCRKMALKLDKVQVCVLRLLRHVVYGVLS